MRVVVLIFLILISLSTARVKASEPEHSTCMEKYFDSRYIGFKQTRLMRGAIYGSVAAVAIAPIFLNPISPGIIGMSWIGIPVAGTIIGMSWANNADEWQYNEKLLSSQEKAYHLSVWSRESSMRTPRWFKKFIIKHEVSFLRRDLRRILREKYPDRSLIEIEKLLDYRLKVMGIPETSTKLARRFIKINIDNGNFCSRRSKPYNYRQIKRFYKKHRVQINLLKEIL